MRFASLILVALCAVSSVAQDRVFRASSIDLEQNERLTAVEARVTVLESAPKQAQPAVKPAPAKIQPTKPLSIPRLAAQKQTGYSTITIETLPGCPPCERWKAKEANELRAQGWVVKEAPLTSSSSAPFFRICIGDKCYSHRGFMSHGALRGILARAFGRSQQSARSSQSVQSSRYTTAELRVLIQQARPGGWTGFAQYADMSPRSQVKNHLVEPKHGFTWEQVSGLTQDEALILHDLAPTHGNQIFPTRSKRGFQ